MGIKQKFFALSGIAGVLLMIVSAVGYYLADTNLEESLAQEIRSTVQVEANELDGWLREKKSAASHAASLMTAFRGDMTRIKAIHPLTLAAADKDILDMHIGVEDGYFASHLMGDKSALVDPRTRPWYEEGKKASTSGVFTEPYVDGATQQLVVSAIAPFTHEGRFMGTLRADIGLDALDKQVEELKYNGEGIGVVLDAHGRVLAATNGLQRLSDLRDVQGIGAHVEEMIREKDGFFSFQGSDGEKVFAYATLPTSGWMIGISIPYDFVYAPLTRLKLTFGVLTLAGFVLITFLCLQFAARITGPIIALEKGAKDMAAGNLRQPPIDVTSSDEIGSLASAFNEMQKNLKNVIGHMASTSQEVVSSSERLMAGSEQSAEAATNVAETVVEVAGGMEKQLANINEAKQNVDSSFADIMRMTEEAREAASASGRTKEAAEHGAVLMRGAMTRMEQIEASVREAAQVVRKQGENSKQIGQMVDAISAIADQTSLLALNAAIEAARAGESGRGFSVVAEEVKKLAEQSQTSAEEIKKRVSEIQRDTEVTVAAMETGTNEVHQGTAAIREVGEKFTQILNMVSNIADRVQGISVSAEKVSKNTTNIVAAVDDIDEVSRKTSEHTQTISATAEEQSASSEEIAAAAQALEKLAEELQAAVNRFKI